MLPLHYGLLGFVLCSLYLAIGRRRRQPYPPGPKPLPIVGNILDVPTSNQYATYTKWKELYGDIVHVKIFGNHIVVLNSAKVVSDILEKRSSKTGGRPYSVMMSELMNLEWFGVTGYNPVWRAHRRLFHSYFGESMAANHRPAHERAVQHLLRRLLDKPDSFLDHIRLQFAEVIMDVVYDVEVKDYSNVFVQTIEKSIAAFAQAIMPGRFLVETLSFLKYVPVWFPGAEFRRLAAQWKECTKQAMELPFVYVKEKIRGGTAGPSMMSHLLEQCETDAEIAAGLGGMSSEHHAKVVAVTAYAAGSDTVLSSIQTFFLLMANHPECQKDAQTELDAVLGGTRLPTYADKDDLPYIRALINELLRWHPVLPTGLPHRFEEDDVYEGYFIPKGTIVVGNTWLLNRDPEVYADPHTFNPMRWLIKTEKGLEFNNSIPEPSVTYGYGRRICPGRFFANDALFLTVASVLTCFTLSPLDSEGKPAKSVPESFTDAIIIYPTPFNLSIKPRSEAIAQLVSDLDLPA